MKIKISTLAVACACYLSCWSATAQNLITNASFENRNRVPQNESNIGPISSLYPYDDLPDWDSPTSINSYSYPPTLLSSDATAQNSTASYNVTPHTGISAVRLLQHDNNGDHMYDQFATQQLAQPLLPCHRYQVQFWAIRPTPSAQYHTKLACYITTANPTYDASQNSLLPSPGSKFISSGDIQPAQGWTLVSGIITIPANETNNQWFTIGYDRSNQTYDPNLPSPFPASPAINYIVDDISLVDLGVAPPSPQLRPANWTCETYGSRGPVPVAIDNYDPNLTYSITTTNNITNSPPGIHSETTPQGTTWYFYLRSTRAGSSGRVTVTASNITATNSCGGASSSSFSAFSPNCQPTSARTMAYPNPANESLTLNESAGSAILYDGQGQEVLRSNGTNKLDTRSLPAGLYYLRTQQKGEQVKQTIQVVH